MSTTLAMIVLGMQAATQPVDACTQLRGVTLPNATIKSVTLVAAGPMSIPGAAQPQGGVPGQAPPPAPILPAHCRVAAVLTPTGDSHIEMELWLPVDRWNGKFQAVGNGGWAGSISYPALALALQEGYATASTDTGHQGGNALFAIDHPEKLVDYAHRAVHEMAVQSKTLIAAYYSRAPQLSYWNGCSTGGRQGLTAALKYPGDFDAIIAGAPANNSVNMHASDISVALAGLKDPAAIVPPDKLALVNRAAVAACDANDGIVDGLINDPRSCTVNVAALQCQAGSTDNCLTPPQVAAVQRMYQPTTMANGEVVYPGKEAGGEPGWAPFLGGNLFPVPVGTFQIAYNNAAWDPKTFDIDRDLQVARAKVSPIIDALDPDLSAFKARGGKVLMYHGWNDNLIPPRNSINYFSRVTETMAGNDGDFIRLFMVPGLNHCAGGVGPNQINWMGALERWREQGAAPERIEAIRIAGNRVDMTRPLCPYPQVAVHSGKGSTNDAANFSCKSP